MNKITLVFEQKIRHTVECRPQDLGNSVILMRNSVKAVCVEMDGEPVDSICLSCNAPILGQDGVASGDDGYICDQCADEADSYMEARQCH